MLLGVYVVVCYSPDFSLEYGLVAPLQHLLNHPKWKTNLITKKKTTRYAITKPNLFHSRLDFGHHAQHAYPASRAFGATIKTCIHPGQSEQGMITSLIIALLRLGRFAHDHDSRTQQHQ